MLKLLRGQGGMLPGVLPHNIFPSRFLIFEKKFPFDRVPTSIKKYRRLKIFNSDNLYNVRRDMCQICETRVFR